MRSAQATLSGLIALLLVISLAPIWWMIATSFKPPIEFVSQSVDMWPNAPTLEHYRDVLTNDVLEKIWNSVVVAIGATALSLLVGFP
ncbi:MAG: carbohydrate ABC transporter permease, partial [Pseudomonadota bacterium]